MTTFCLLHGKWHDPTCWDALAEELRARGHEVHAPDLTLKTLGATWAERAQPATDIAAAADGRVVVVGHSLAAAYAPLAAVAAEEPLLVFLCPAAIGVLANTPDLPQAIRPGFPFPVDDEHRVSAWDPDVALSALYPRLPEDEAAKLVAHLRPDARASGPYPLEAPPAIPTALIYALHDEIFEPEWERAIARERLGVEPIELDSGHFPILEMPDELARVLDAL